jgi:hypothetical protein
MGMAKVTSSSNRSKRSTTKPVTKGQNPQRANRQAVSKAKVTSASNGKPTGAAASRVTMGRGMTSAAKTLGTIRSLMGPAGVAAAVSAPRPTADGTLTAAMKRGDYKPRQGPAVPKRLTQGGMDKGSFDKAFKASRTAGKKTFSWRGKKYTTEMK